jgi:hypothetical protein
MGPFSPHVARLIGSFHSASAPFGWLQGQEFISTIDSGYCQFRKVRTLKTSASGRAPRPQVFCLHK